MGVVLSAGLHGLGVQAEVLADLDGLEGVHELGGGHQLLWGWAPYRAPLVNAFHQSGIHQQLVFAPVGEWEEFDDFHVAERRGVEFAGRIPTTGDDDTLGYALVLPANHDGVGGRSQTGDTLLSHGGGGLPEGAGADGVGGVAVDEGVDFIGEYQPALGDVVWEAVGVAEVEALAEEEPGGGEDVPTLSSPVTGKPSAEQGVVGYGEVPEEEPAVAVQYPAAIVSVTNGFHLEGGSECVLFLLTRLGLLSSNLGGDHIHFPADFDTVIVPPFALVFDCLGAGMSGESDAMSDEHYVISQLFGGRYVVKQIVEKVAVGVY